MSSLHVLVVPSWYPASDAPTLGVFFKEQAGALHRAGIRIGVVYPELRSLRRFALKGIWENHFQFNIAEENGIKTCRIHGWNIPPLRIGSRLWVRLARRLIALYIQRFGKPDLLHAHCVLWGGYAAALAAQKEGIPYVITEHSSAYAHNLIRHWQVPFIRESLGTAAGVIAVSRNLGESLKKYAPEIDVEVIPNLVDTEFFKPPQEARSRDPFLLLTVAALTTNKGIDVLVRAFAQAFSRDSDVRLEIGGDGPQRSELEGLVTTLRIEHMVRFLGALSREQVRDAMRRAKCFVLPSYVETFGVVLIEAMATGLPVVATRSGGPEEIVTKDSGILVPPGSVEVLADALRYMVENCEQFDLFRLRNLVQERYSERVVVKQLTAAYEGARSNRVPASFST